MMCMAVLISPGLGYNPCKCHPSTLKFLVISIQSLLVKEQAESRRSKNSHMANPRSKHLTECHSTGSTTKEGLWLELRKS